VVLDIICASESPWRHYYPGYESGVGGGHAVACAAIGLEVKAGVEMVVAEFPEVSRQVLWGGY